MFIVINSTTGAIIRGPLEDSVNPALGGGEVVFYGVPAAYADGSVVWNATLRRYVDAGTTLLELLVSKGIITSSEAATVSE